MGAWYIYGETAMMIHSGTNVKTIDSVRAPGAALGRGFEANDAHAKGGDWLVVEVVRAV
jgi:hypothetical protein